MTNTLQICLIENPENVAELELRVPVPLITWQSLTWHPKVM
jgi:hypothetical protein